MARPPIEFAARITGDRALDAKLRTLEPRLAKKHVRTVLRSRIKPLAAAAKAAAPRQTGALAKGIKVQATKRSRRGLGIKVQLGSELARAQNREAQGARTRWPFYGALRELGPRGAHFLEGAFRSGLAGARTGVILDLRRALESETPKAP